MFNANVICIKEYNAGVGVTINKIYKIKDGKLTYDNGSESFTEFKDIEILNNRNIAKFKYYREG